jgi:hypothetical protein
MAARPATHQRRGFHLGENRPGDRGILLIRLGGEMTAFTAKDRSAEQ